MTIETEIILDAFDFEWMEEFTKKFNIPEGKGLHNLVQLTMNEYKKHLNGLNQGGGTTIKTTSETTTKEGAKY